MISVRVILLLWSIGAVLTSIVFDKSADSYSDRDLERILSANPNVVNVYERYALQEIYESMNGPYWTWYSDHEQYGIPWDVYNSSSDPCYNNWQAILCTCHLEQDDFERPFNSYLENYIYVPESYMSFYEMYFGVSPVCHIERLGLADYNLTGQIPDAIGYLGYLTRLHMSNNQITGTLPDGILYLGLLRTLSVGRNLITGTIPDTIGYNLTGLSVISVFSNQMTGTIPASFGNMFFMGGFYLGLNYFTGTLPPELGNCFYMNYLDASSNQLTGSIPEEWYRPNFWFSFITIFRNHLTGTVPLKILSDCKTLQFFYYDDNLIHGDPQLDFIIHNATQISQYGFKYNLMTGTLPTVHTDDSNLEWISATHNQLHGTIPPSLVRLKKLVMVELTSNSFEGSLPSTIGEMTNLKYFYASETFLTGSIPQDIGSASQLIIFNCSLTMISGPIPESLATLNNITTIELYSNRLTGTIPQGILTGSPVLSILLLQNNQLEGPMIGEELLNTQSSVEFLDVSNNRLGGTIVPELFSNSYQLKSLALGKNCIFATLPKTICERGELQVLAMDGMNTVCHSNTAKQSRQFIGTLPDCLFHMPSLETLHLSGNRITGSIPDMNSVSDILSDLSLSHNDLHGSIPLALQTRTWKNIDLSYNKLSNGLHKNFAVSYDNETHPKISLLVNRLSGAIPETFRNAEHINVLQGSLFECAYSQTDLPNNDPVSSRFSCGTNSLNVLLYIWFSLLVVGLVVTFYWYGEEAAAYPIQWKYLTSMSCIFKRLSQYVMMILLPVYLACSYHYKNYSHSYAWVVSSVYLSGMVPGVLFLILWFGFLAIFFYYCETRLFFMEFRRNLLFNYMARIDPSRAPIVKRGWTWNRVMYSILLYAFIVANMVMVVAVNAAYVYVNINYSNTIGNLAEAGLAVFKLTWNSYFLPFLLKHILVKPAHKLRQRSITNSSFTQFSRMFSQARSLRFSRAFSRSDSNDSAQVDGGVRELTNYQKIAEQDQSVFNSIVVETLLNLFNNIIAPCIATMGVDVKCFYNVFVPPDTVTAQYSLTTCSARDYDYNCIETQSFSFETSYVPPFSYSYQCSSTLVTSYVSVFVFMFIFDTFFAPVLSECMKKFLKWRKESRKAKQRQQDVESGVAGPVPENIHNEYRQLDFLKNRFIIKSVSNMAILVTFGMMFPPLAFIICYNVWREYRELHERITNFYEQELRHKAKEHRMIAARRHSTLKSNLVRFLEEKFLHVSNITSFLLWLLFPLASFFYAFFVFDMIGDVYGWSTAIPATIIMGLLPILALWIKELYRYYHLEWEQEQKAQRHAEEEARKASSTEKPDPDPELSLSLDESSSMDSGSRKLDHTRSDIELIDLYRENEEIEEDDTAGNQSPRNKKKRSSAKRKESLEEGMDDCCQQLMTAFFR